LLKIANRHQKNINPRPPFQALLTFEKLVKLKVLDHISLLKTDIQDKEVDKIHFTIDSQ
jgi:hypothetical protein